MQYYVIKFVSDLRQWFSPGSSVSSTIKTDRHYITEILLEMALKNHSPNHNNPRNILAKQNSKNYMRCIKELVWTDLPFL